MFQGIFKSAINDANKNYIFGTGSIPINIKVANLETFADGTTKQQGYQVAEVNKLISTMLTGWDANGNKPKSMSDNYLELILSCDNGFVVKKRLQFPHIIAWQNDNTPYNIADVYKPFSIDNWLKADDFENPDITLVVEPTDEILTTSTANPSEATTEQSGRFYLYYRNLPVGVNRIHIDFHIKTKTEPIYFDLEVVDGLSWKDAQTILASNEQAKINVLLSGVKDVYNFTGAEGNFEDITMHEWNALYQQIISLKPSNKFTHELFFVLYESEINKEITDLDTQILKRFPKKYTIAQGGSITFDTIVLQEDGDSLEIGVNTSVSSQTNGGYAFSISPNIGFGVTDRLFILRGDDSTWLTSGDGYHVFLTNMDYIIKLSYENGNTIVYLNGTEIGRFTQQVKISISGIGNLSKSDSYGYWTGTIFKYVYTHNGISTSIEKFNNLNVNSKVTIINSNTQLSPNVSLGNTQLSQTDNRCKVRYINGSGRGASTERLEFFVPTNGGYIKYEYVHSVNTEINANNWRIHNAYFCNFDFKEILDLTLSGEWEVALHLQGRDDFSGGIAHGDEVMDNIAFFLDGKKVIKEDLTTLTDCREFRAVGMSNMYDPIDSVTLMAKHGCEHVFNMDGMQVNQNIVWQGEFNLSECYMAMFPSKKFGTDQLYMNINYDIETLPSSNFRKTYGFANNVSIFSANSGFFANIQVIDYPRGLHGGDAFWCLDNGGIDYNKMYWVVTTGGIVVNNGTTWLSSVKYSIKYTL